MSLNYYSESETKDVNPDAYFMRQALIEAQKAAERDEVPVVCRSFGMVAN